jgi:DNA-binding transcriptional LysR family regulator
VDAAHAAVLSGLALCVLPLHVAANDPKRVRTLIDFLQQRFKPVAPWESGTG